MIDQDLQHLKLLSLFHYILGGMTALLACFPLIHVGVGLTMLLAPEAMTDSRGQPPPRAFGLLFALLGGGCIAVGWITALALALNGWFLRRHQHYLFCLIVAALACLYNPFGTVLGVFTLVVLVRPSVKQLFDTDKPPDEQDTAKFSGDHITQDRYKASGGR